jgi:hypothetical protein
MMAINTTIVACAYCGTLNPYRVVDSYGWVKLICSAYSCGQRFEADIQTGKVIATRRIETPDQSVE